MTNQQPETLRLANKLEPVHSASTPLLDLHREAAVELRRLYAECDNRMQAINGLTKLANGYHDDLMTLREAVKRLHAANMDCMAWYEAIKSDYEAMRKAVVKLHAAKGRYHTQIAACDLYDLCDLKNERPTK